MRNLIMFALLVFLLISAQITKAQTADDIIKKFIKALGGEEKILSLQTVKRYGTTSIDGMEASVITTIKNGVGLRADFAVPNNGEGYQIINRTKGWVFMPFHGQANPEELSEEDVKNAQAYLDIQGLLVNYKEKGSVVELLGTENAKGAEAYKIRLINNTGMESIFFIDTSNYNLVKLILRVKTALGDEDVETIFGDFRKNEDGFLFPYAYTNSKGKMLISKIETNRQVDDNFFSSN